jgi:hypothetical protein
MYIRFKFDNIESDETKKTMQLFLGIPNGMFLSSSHAHMVYSNGPVFFWYIDVNILNVHYGGVINCLNKLLEYPGVCSADILPIEGEYNYEIADDLINDLMQYVDC